MEEIMLKALNENAERWALLVLYILLVATMAVEVIRREVFAAASARICSSA